jgi:predicted dehydrogenase
MQKIRVAIIGTGFMGRVHTESLRRLGYVEVSAIVGSRIDTAKQFAENASIPHATDNIKNVLDDLNIAAVHICTPNVEHYPMSMEAIASGKAVLCEKPLAMNVSEARSLVEQSARYNVVTGVQHNLRYYPVVQQIRQMIAAGELGEILIVQGTYSQDWLLYDTDWNWRIDPKANGDVRVVADIGTHWMDMIEHLTGLRITRLCADLATFHKTRKRPKGSVETFAGKKAVRGDVESIPVHTDDFGVVMLRLGDSARGAFTVSQMSAGRKNRFAFEIFGSKAGVAWDQEKPDSLWIGYRDEPNRVLVKDSSLMYPAAATFSDLPGGHSEGYDDSHKQLFKRFYARVVDSAVPIDYPTFEDGLRGMTLVDRIAESSASASWVDV